MQKGDKAILINRSKLGQCGMGICEGKTVTILRPDASIPNRWWVHVSDPPVAWLPTTEYWVYTECIQLVGRDPRENLWIAGDEAVLVDAETLRDVSMGGNLGKTVTLKRLLTQSEKDNRAYAKRYQHENVWWIRLPGLGDNYYVPERCLNKPQRNHQPSVDAYAGIETDIKPPGYYGQEQKEQDSMYLHRVTIISTPSVIAQQGGEVAKIIVPMTEIMAADISGATAQVAAMNAEAILALKDQMATIKVVAKLVG
jgi:hypothetical protein